MSDHQSGGGLPVVGILGVLVVLPVAGWLFFSTNAAPSSPPPVPIHTPATAPIPVREAGSSIVPAEETPEQVEPADNENTASSPETTETESTLKEPSGDSE